MTIDNLLYEMECASNSLPVWIVETKHFKIRIKIYPNIC